MAGPRRVERRFQPSEGCALSFGRGAAKWYGRKDSNLQVSRFVAEYPVQLNDARVKTLWQREVDSNHCLPGQSRKSWPLNDPAVAGSGRIERPKLASKTSGFPLTELPLTLGWTGGNRTRVKRATVFRSATDLRSTQNLLVAPVVLPPAFIEIRRWQDHRRYRMKQLVDLRGIEPRSARCRRAVLPLNERPMVAAPGFEPGNVLAYETELVPTSPQ